MRVNNSIENGSNEVLLYSGQHQLLNLTQAARIKIINPVVFLSHWPIKYDFI